MKLDSDNESLANKAIKIHTMAIVVRSVFYENYKCYSKVFLDECLHKFQLLEFAVF